MFAFKKERTINFDGLARGSGNKNMTTHPLNMHLLVGIEDRRLFASLQLLLRVDEESPAIL